MNGHWSTVPSPAPPGLDPGCSFASAANPKSLRFLSAFTLIELMIVISIVAMIMAMGVPAFVRGMRKEGLRKAVADVVEGCSQARAYAILRGVPAELSIRAEDGQLTVRPAPVRKSEDGGAGLGSTFASESTPPPAAASAMANFRSNLPEEIAIKLLYVNFKDQMELPEAHVRFFPNGTSDEFTMILLAPTGEQQISLDVITGLADVKVIR